LGVSIKESFGIKNFLALPLIFATLTYMGTFINVAVIYLLKDPNIFNIPED
jgi:hypothetical protein